MIDETVLDELKNVVEANRIIYDKYEVLTYECDAQTFFKNAPDVVVFPITVEEVSKIVDLCNKHNIPFLARGSGTALCGSAVAIKGGVMIAFSRMRKIIEIDIDNQRVVVEPYVTANELTTLLSKDGFFYAPDPASYVVSSIGGNIAHNAGGNHCIKYGVTTNHVLGLEVVLPSGEVLEIGGKALDTPGYDLVGLMVGSEGTLGIITKATLRILRRPPGTAAILAVFNSVLDASNTVSEVIAKGLTPAAIEFMDQLAIIAVESGVKACGLPKDAAAILLFEVEGYEDELEAQGREIIEICQKNHARSVEMAKDPIGIAKLMAGRKAAFGSMGNLAPAFVVDDGTIPRSKLPEMMLKIKKISEESGLMIANVFHAGEGNLHPLILYNPRGEGEAEKALEVGLEILKMCLDVGGTITGEHGVGVEKKELMPIQFSGEELRIMAAIKKIFDPLGLCNPGKIIPEKFFVQ
ncbi:MAG: FAD-linked oxidase C-terminal domain-containing protein [Nitrososphaerota archaeon]